MKLKILAIGKLKERYFTEAVLEYEKRLSRYADIEVIEFPDEKTGENLSTIEEEQIREKEAEKVLKYLDSHPGYRVALAIKGEQPDSVRLSEELSELLTKGNSTIFFLIGGSLGLSKALLENADWKLSFSNMTFPHQLMRVILLEQLYRAMRIMHHEPYHK